MKTTIYLILLLFALLVPRAQAQTPSYVDLYVAYDTDAEAYIANAGVVDPISIARINAFVIGLKQLNLWTNCVQLLALRTNQNTGAGTTAAAIKGNSVTLTGTPSWDDDGLRFWATNASYGTFNNPFQSTAISSYTICVGFSGAHSNSATCVVGSYNTGATGPSIWINSDPSAGNITNSITSFWSTNGTANEGFNGQPGRIISRSAQNGTNQLVFASRDTASGFKMKAGIDGPYAFQPGALSPVWNNNSTWRIGATLVPGSYLRGAVAFLAIWTKTLTDSEYDSVRRLYARTLGAGWMPNVNLYLEGDSLTAADVIGTEVSWGRQLHYAEPWQGNFSKRLMAVSGALCSTMANEVITNLYAFARDGTDYAQAQVYSVWGGVNDIGASQAAQTVYDNLALCWSRARAAGFKVVGWTVAPSGNIQGAKETQRLLLNDMIRQSRGKWDWLVDVARVPSLQDTNSAHYHTDHEHFTTLGHTEISKEFVRSVPFLWSR